MTFLYANDNVGRTKEEWRRVFNNYLDYILGIKMREELEQDLDKMGGDIKDRYYFPVID